MGDYKNKKNMNILNKCQTGLIINYQQEQLTNKYLYKKQDFLKSNHAR